MKSVLIEMIGAQETLAHNERMHIITQLEELTSGHAGDISAFVTVASLGAVALFVKIWNGNKRINSIDPVKN